MHNGIACTTGINRDTIDKFYTKKAIAKMCFDAVKRNINISKEDLVIEPSAGNGAFIPFIKRLSRNHAFYDIVPDHEEVVEKDFLAIDNRSFGNGRAHAVGNPPFGRKSSIAKMFIRKCCEFCHSVSFILPRTFKKREYQTAFPLNFHMREEIVLPDSSFTVDGNDHTVACVFQVWERKDRKRSAIKKIKPIGYSFVKKTASPDLSIRRVGHKAGTVSRNFAKKNENTHYFLKFNEGADVESIATRLNSAQYDTQNVGAKSISKQQFINKLNRIFRKRPRS